MFWNQDLETQSHTDSEIFLLVVRFDSASMCYVGGIQEKTHQCFYPMPVFSCCNTDLPGRSGKVKLWHDYIRVANWCLLGF